VKNRLDRFFQHSKSTQSRTGRGTIQLGAKNSVQKRNSRDVPLFIGFTQKFTSKFTKWLIQPFSNRTHQSTNACNVEARQESTVILTLL
jgi:hypothetical protein